MKLRLVVGQGTILDSNRRWVPAEGEGSQSPGSWQLEGALPQGPHDSGAWEEFPW